MLVPWPSFESIRNSPPKAWKRSLMLKRPKPSCLGEDILEIVLREIDYGYGFVIVIAKVEIPLVAL